MKKFIIVIFVIICTIFLTGCSKDRVIKTFDDASKKFGDEILTKDNDLIGKRSFGIDHYTGTYVSSYENITKKETIFGGTTLNRNEDNIHIKIYLEKVSGEITIKMNLNEEEKILTKDSGLYEFDFNVKSGSNYFVIDTNNFTGNVDILIN